MAGARAITSRLVAVRVGLLEGRDQRHEELEGQGLAGLAGRAEGWSGPRCPRCRSAGRSEVNRKLQVRSNVVPLLMVTRTGRVSGGRELADEGGDGEAGLGLRVVGAGRSGPAGRSPPGGGP